MTRTDEELVKAERRRMAAAFDDVLAEPIPDRLQALLAPPAAPVVDLAAQRSRRRAMPGWAAWGGMAATLVLGTVLGTQIAGTGPVDSTTPQLVATGAVAQALEHRLASDGIGPVTVQLSYKDRQGRYCRSFATHNAAGLACREPGGAWSLQQVVAGAPAASGALRQAATPLPPAVLAEVDAQASAGPLNAAQERAARDAGWRP